MPRPDGSIHLLVVARDPTLRAEFETALPGVRTARVVAHYAGDHHQGIETARFRTPELICVEMTRDLAALKSFVRDAASVAPGVRVAAVYRPEEFSEDGAEGQAIVDALRARVEDFLRRPLSSAELQQLLDRGAPAPEPASRGLGTVVAFLSNRGGVGKSTLAVNTAVALAARHHGRVLLVDAALQLGVCAPMLDLTPATSIVDAARERERLDETLLHQLTTPHASGVRLLASATDAIEAAEVSDETVTRVLGLARRAFDFVIVDTFPMVGRFLLATLDLSDLGYVVVQGTVPAVNGAPGLLRSLDHVGFGAARQRIVLSRNYAPFAGDLRVDDVELTLEREIDHLIPYDRRLLRALNTGRPRILSCSGLWGFGRAIGDLVRDIEAVRPVEPARRERRRWGLGWRSQREPAAEETV
jgi:pilus assembly protein CpaE